MINTRLLEKPPRMNLNLQYFGNSKMDICECMLKMIGNGRASLCDQDITMEMVLHSKISNPVVANLLHNVYCIF